MFSQSVYLAKLFLGRLSPLSSKLVLVHIISPETDNCPGLLETAKEENDRKKYSMIILHKKMLPDPAEIESVNS